MQLPVKYMVSSEADTINAANEFASLLKGGEVIALKGELGAGKTFFVKAVLRNLNVENVNSPSFAIVYEYDGKFRVNHFDFYRINKIGELYDIGFEEYLSDEETVTFIEWADLFPEILPKKRIDIQINIMDNFNREIKIQNHI